MIKEWPQSWHHQKLSAVHIRHHQLILASITLTLAKGKGSSSSANRFIKITGHTLLALKTAFLLTACLKKISRLLSTA